MNILVTGANGQLGNEIKLLCDEKNLSNFIFTDIETLDITDLKKLNDFTLSNSISCIINCAAYTQVDKAEIENELCDSINFIGVQNLVKCCLHHKIKLIHISSDYVYDDSANIPLKENMPLNPQSYYAKSKLKGEYEIINSNIPSVIIRTSWLYGKKGHNFVKTIINKAKKESFLKVVFDQIGTPTNAEDLANTILTLYNSSFFKQLKNNEIFNYSNEGVTSWYDFAKAITEILNLNCEILPIYTHEYPTLAKRPRYSVLDKTKIKNTLNIKIPWWYESLEKFILNNKQIL